jgi:hypothetical protein
MSKKVSKEVIDAFALAVYPQYTSLSFITNSLEDTLKEATRLINDKQRILDMIEKAIPRLQERLKELRAKNDTRALQETQDLAELKALLMK